MKYFYWPHTFCIKWVLLYISMWCVCQSWVISCCYACRWYHRRYSLPPACSLERKLRKNFVETQSSTKFLLLHSLAQYNKWSGKQHAQDMGVGCHSNGWYSYGKGGCCRMCATSTTSTWLVSFVTTWFWSCLIGSCEHVGLGSTWL